MSLGDEVDGICTVKKYRFNFTLIADENIMKDYK